METMYEKAQKLSSENFKLVIGVRKETFQEMLTCLNVAYKSQHRQGGRARKLSMEEQLMMTLRHLRYYPTQRLLAFDFSVGVATANVTLTWVENTLRSSGLFELDNLEAPSILTIDVIESPIQRPKNQRKSYSGKKKDHTINTQITLNCERNQVCQWAFSDGHTHGFTLFKTSIDSSLAKDTMLFVDLGYQSIFHYHENSFIPPKNSKHHRLTEDEKQLKREMAAIRIQIEHFNAKFKTFQIMKQDHRGRRKRFEIRAELFYGIINFETS